MYFTLVVLAFLAVAVTALLLPALKLRQDAREPPLIRPAIPFIGHVINLIRYSNSYNTLLRQQYPHLDCYTLHLYSSKAYVINTLGLTSAVQRNTKALSFDPLLEQTAKLLGGVSEDGLAKHSAPGVSARLLKQMHPQLLPGPALDAMNRSMVADVAVCLNTLLSKHEQGYKIDLYQWVRDTIGIASTNAVWGKALNPFANQRVFSAFETYEKNLMPLFLGFAPRLLAKDGYNSRELIAKAFINYVRKGGVDTASGLVQARARVQFDELGFSDEDFARIETTLGLGVLGNIIPTSFWMLFTILGKPDLLSVLRKELWPMVQRERSEEQQIFSLDVSKLRTEAPLLLSLFQEILRTRSTSAMVRFVREDTMLADKYLLKKGNIVQVPAPVLHTEKSFWGPDADALNPERFMSFQQGDAKINPASFRGFGGGDHICPGRYFAAAETLSMVATLILTFDIEPVSKSWNEPLVNTSMFSSSVLPPKGEVPVKLTRRPEFFQAQWQLTLSEDKGRFRLASG